MSKQVLKIENLSKTFGRRASKVKAVNNVSFSVNSGEIVLVMGPSGSGKTTLLTMIGALLTVDSGKIIYGDIEVTSLPKSRLSEIRSLEIGFIFQSFNLLLALNVWENVAVVLEFIGVPSNEARKRAKSLLRKLGLSKRLDYHVSNLSGGEKQRVSIARALINNPRLILADEPTANLDFESGYKVMELLKDIAQKENRAVVVVTHDLRLVNIADRVLWMDDGRIRTGKDKIVIDPVCKIPIKKHQSLYTLFYKQKRYYFCSMKCLEKFKGKNGK